MICLSCRGFAHNPLCRPCTKMLRPAPPRRLDCGILVHASFVHEGAARRLVHRLKYDGATSAARLLVEPLVELVGDAELLVPIPRVGLRRLRYGVDASAVIAERLGAMSGVPVGSILGASWWAGRHAGRARDARSVPRFRARSTCPDGAVLIDDVVTTGGTLAAARSALGGAAPRAACATSADVCSSRRPQLPISSND